QEFANFRKDGTGKVCPEVDAIAVAATNEDAGGRQDRQVPLNAGWLNAESAGELVKIPPALRVQVSLRKHSLPCRAQLRIERLDRMHSAYDCTFYASIFNRGRPKPITRFAFYSPAHARLSDCGWGIAGARKDFA